MTHRAAWASTPPDIARRLHEVYTSTVTDRIARFGMHLDQSGLVLGSLDWNSLDAFDEVWFWAQENLSMFDHRSTRFASTPTPWHPYMPGVDMPDHWPTWSGVDNLSIEANEFAAGVAALLAQFALDQWRARWVLVGNRSMLEIPRQFEHPSARFGPVRFSPEVVVAQSVRDFLRHPLWYRRPPWHALLDRIQCTSSSWADLTPDVAERFHDDFVGGHIRRLSCFREELLRQGFDTTSMRFDHVADVDAIWAWARDNLSFAEQVTVPRREYRTWFPTLSQNATSTDGLPRWSEHNLSAETLEFASGLAACVTEVALRSWAADWSLGGHRGDTDAVNRPHLRIQAPDGTTNWIDVERSMIRWLAAAVITTKRRLPRRALWPMIFGTAPVAGRVPLTLFGDMFATPPAPWVHWHARFSDRLFPTSALPEPAPHVAPLEPFHAEEHQLVPQPAAVPMSFSNAVTGSDALASLDLHVEPDDDQGEHFWIVQIADSVASACPRLVTRFASRLNRSRGVASAALLNSSTLTMRMTRFGPNDLEDVEAVCLKVWQQTRATHREPTIA